MKFLACYLECLGLLASASFARPVSNQGYSRQNIVETTSGQVYGFINDTYPNVRQFLGIHYAVPPEGDLRFAPPSRLYSPGTPINATQTPFACPQHELKPPMISSVDTPGLNNHAPWSEDCLSVSIWAPTLSGNASESKLPVFIFLHGGAFISGSSSVPYQQPTPWIQRSQTHIVVNVQYRLDIFGFPNAEGLNSTNLAIQDQRMAIEWVRDNIAAFGGDTERMVLWGQSAGAASIDAQNFAFPNDPIVQGFIQDSGTAIPIGMGLALVTFDDSHSNFTFVANHFNCSNDPTEQVKCMRGVSATDIVSFLRSYYLAGTSPPLYFIGTPDNKYVFSNYTEQYSTGRFSSLPEITGTNAQEGELFVPFPSDPSHNAPNQTLAREFTLSFLQCPAALSARLRDAQGRKSYRYIYAGNFTDISPDFWEGAYHESELPQLFGTRGLYNAPASAYEIQTSSTMQDMWLAFANDPENPKGWEEQQSGKLLMFGASDGSAVKTVEISDVDQGCMSV